MDDNDLVEFNEIKLSEDIINTVAEFDLEGITKALSHVTEVTNSISQLVQASIDRLSQTVQSFVDSITDIIQTILLQATTPITKFFQTLVEKNIEFHRFLNSVFSFLFQKNKSVHRILVLSLTLISFLSLPSLMKRFFCFMQKLMQPYLISLYYKGDYILSIIIT